MDEGTIRPGQKSPKMQKKQGRPQTRKKEKKKKKEKKNKRQEVRQRAQRGSRIKGPVLYNTLNSGPAGEILDPWIPLVFLFLFTFSSGPPDLPGI